MLDLEFALLEGRLQLLVRVAPQPWQHRLRHLCVAAAEVHAVPGQDGGQPQHTWQDNVYLMLLVLRILFMLMIAFRIIVAARSNAAVVTPTVEKQHSAPYYTCHTGAAV